MMNVWLSQDCCVTKYNDREWEFIEKLPEYAKKNIIWGLATPYDYGYEDK